MKHIGDLFVFTIMLAGLLYSGSFIALLFCLFVTVVMVWSWTKE